MDAAIGDEEDIYRFLDQKGMELAGTIIERYSYVPSYLEDKEFYIDWGRTEEFSLSGLGPGECGAGVLDMIESDLTEARMALEEAERTELQTILLQKTLFLASRALLVVKGSDPKTEEEAFSDFKEKFIDEGIASEEYSSVGEVFGKLKKAASPEEKKERVSYVRGFLEHINGIYKSMDPSFSFPKLREEKSRGEKKEAGLLMDLKGTPCPINYVKVKLKLEDLMPGQILEVLLDEGEPIQNVPQSLEKDGHRILKMEKENGFYRVVVEKR